MKKLALSVVVLMVASAGVSISGAGCSSSSGSGASSGSSGSGSGSDATADSSGSSSGSDANGDTGSSSGVDSSSGSDASEGGSCTVSEAGGIPVGGLDGGENTACEMCLGTSCCDQQNACVNDSNLQVGDDAGTMYPACDLFINCVYPELTQLILTTDAGLMSDLTTAVTDCSGADGGNFPPDSIAAGTALLTCAGTACAASCIP